MSDPLLGDDVLLEEAIPLPTDADAPVARNGHHRRAPRILTPVDYDLEAEAIVLGAMMDGLARELFAIVSVDEFYSETHVAIAETIARLDSQDATTDPVAVWGALTAAQRQQLDGGAAYLHTLYSSVPARSMAPYHARTVAEHARRRGLRDAMLLASQALTDGQPTDHVMLELHHQLETMPASAGSRVRILTIDDLRSLPAPAPLVEGVLSRDVLATLWGPSGHGKSLLALEMALSIASGLSWHERAVHQGPVVMVVAEGVTATSARIDAWLAYHEIAQPEDFYIVPNAVNLFDRDDPREFVNAVAALGVEPVLVIFDTLARSMVGGDENAAKDMGLVVAAGDQIRAQTGASILFVHHSGRDGDHERGSTALFAACDTVMSAVRDEDGIIEIQSRKQKDRPDFEPFTLTFQPVDNSVVLVPIDPSERPAYPPKSAISVLAQLWHHFGTKPVSASSWMEASGVAKRTFYRAKKYLVDGGFVVESGTDARPKFTITEKGEELMVP